MMPLAFQDQPLLRLALLPYVAIRECLRWRRVHATCYTVPLSAACGVWSFIHAVLEHYWEFGTRA